MKLDLIAERLSKQKIVRFRPRGNSMVPLINSGDLVTLERVDDPTTLVAGDIVLCKVAGSFRLHLIKATKKEKKKKVFLISNAKGRENGWTSNVFGKKIPNSFDKEELREALRAFVKEHWTIESKITSATANDEGLIVRFLTQEAKDKFKIEDYRGIPIYRGTRDGYSSI